MSLYVCAFVIADIYYFNESYESCIIKLVCKLVKLIYIEVDKKASNDEFDRKSRYFETFWCNAIYYKMLAICIIPVTRVAVNFALINSDKANSKYAYYIRMEIG